MQAPRLRRARSLAGRGPQEAGSGGRGGAVRADQPLCAGRAPPASANGTGTAACPGVGGPGVSFHCEGPGAAQPWGRPSEGPRRLRLSHARTRGGRPAARQAHGGHRRPGGRPATFLQPCCSQAQRRQAGRRPEAGDELAHVVGLRAAAAGAHETWVDVTRLQAGLCGASRAHFFRGVATARPPGAPARV